MTYRYILIQKSDSEIIQAAVAAVFIQDIDEITYGVFLPSAFRAHGMPEFETPPYNSKYGICDGEILQKSMRYNKANGLIMTRILTVVGKYVTFLFKIPVLVGVSTAVVVGVRGRLCNF